MCVKPDQRKKGLQFEKYLYDDIETQRNKYINKDKIQIVTFGYSPGGSLHSVSAF